MGVADSGCSHCYPRTRLNRIEVEHPAMSAKYLLKSALENTSLVAAI